MGEQEAGGGGGADMDLEDMEESDEEGGEEEEEPEEEDESETMNQVSFSKNGEGIRLSRFFFCYWFASLWSNVMGISYPQLYLFRLFGFAE